MTVICISVTERAVTVLRHHHHADHGIRREDNTEYYVLATIAPYARPLIMENGSNWYATSQDHDVPQVALDSVQDAHRLLSSYPTTTATSTAHGAS